MLTFKEIKHLSDYRTVRGTIGPSDYRTVGLSDCRTIGLSDYRSDPKKTHDKNLKFNLEGIEIECETEVKLLGVTIDFKLNFNEHIKHL